MKFNRFSILFLLGLVFLQFSCTRDSGEELLYSPDLKMPVVTGLFLSGPDSPEVLLVWGNPSGSSFCYPSFGTNTSVLYSIGKITRVKIWVVPARLPKQNQTDIYDKLGGYFINASGLSVITLINDFKEPGSYYIQYNFKDTHGNPLPEGFYRIYKQIGDWLTWCDVLYHSAGGSEYGYYTVLNDLGRFL